jgi:hypothetical protein
MEFLLWSAIGCIVGSIVTSVIFYVRCHYGTLRIDHSDPEKDIYRFDVDDLDKLSKKKRIMLKIDNNADLSQ